MEILKIIAAVEGCKKHECSTVSISICKKCPSFAEVYLGEEGTRVVRCLFPGMPLELAAGIPQTESDEEAS